MGHVGHAHTPSDITFSRAYTLSWIVVNFLSMRRPTHADSLSHKGSSDSPFRVQIDVVHIAFEGLVRTSWPACINIHVISRRRFSME